MEIGEGGDGSNTGPAPSGGRCKGRAGPIAFGVVVSAILLAGFIFKDEFSGAVEWGEDWLRDKDDSVKITLFTLAQALAVMLILPGTPFNIAAGTLFGKVMGSVISIVAIDLSSVVSFLVARYLARSWAEDQMARRPKFQAVDKAVKKTGWSIIFLVRLAPIFPYGLCSYLFGVTDVSFLTYITATTAGTIPGTVAFAVMGSLGKDLQKHHSGTKDTTVSSINSTAFLVVSILATLAVIMLVTIVTRRALLSAIHATEIEGMMGEDGDELEECVGGGEFMGAPEKALAAGLAVRIGGEGDAHDYGGGDDCTDRKGLLQP